MLAVAADDVSTAPGVREAHPTVADRTGDVPGMTASPRSTDTPRSSPGNRSDGVPPGGGSVSGSEPVVPARLPRPPLPGWCQGWRDAQVRADLMLAGRYQLGSHPAVTLGLDPTWREDPLKDRNWGFLFHAQTGVLSLLSAWVATQDRRYYDRAEFLLRDWYEDNPRLGAPSVWSWNDHSTALRAIVYACASRYFPNRPWMTAALMLHGRTLADPGFYHYIGNHALNQSIGLLEVGAVVRRANWQRLANQRITTLVRASVDSEGVTNEQSTAYQLYNLSRYRLAEARLTAVGLRLTREFSRLDLMAAFLAHATLPNGHLEQIGDTEDMATPQVRGTWAQYAGSGGAIGPKPTSTYRLYRAGYLFARSGWGDTRPFADEVFTSLRFGRGVFIHGHADGTAVTLYGYGSRLLVDPGKFSYNEGPYRDFFIGRTAHNVVSVDGLSWNPKATTTLVGHAATATMVDATVSTAGYPGVSQRRRMTFSRRLNYMLIEDRGTAAVTRTYRQLWHLDDNAAPVVSTETFRTTHVRGNLLVRHLIPVASSRVVAGRASPIQGWVSYRYGVRIPAPVVEVTKRGTSVRFLTLLVPAVGRPSASVTDLVVTAGGYSATITIGTHAERVVVNGTSAAITTLR